MNATLVNAAQGLAAATLFFGVAALPACSNRHASVSSSGAVASGETATPSSDAGSVVTSGHHILARIRRLASAEYDASVRALFSMGRTAHIPASGPAFPPDLRQDGFTVNDAQRVDAVVIERLAEAADTLATEAQQNGTLARLAPCSNGSDPVSCALAFIMTFGAKVYRRPLVGDEVTALQKLYSVGADGATYLDGIAHVTRGLLQSAGFLYLTELGPGGGAKGSVNLTPYELASSLSYLFTSGPPDDAMLAKAKAGALSDPNEREAEARRLLAHDRSAQDTVVRLVREWLGIDGIDDSAKDSLVYPDFEKEKPKIVAESSDFVRAVVFQSTGNVSELFGAHWTVNSGPLDLYKSAGNGPIPGTTLITDRVGILNQAAFLATYANAHESHPVFRGVAIARRVVCRPLDSPASFDITVVPPIPNPHMTTRERFDAHVVDPICAGCHDIIDPFGFPFEQFDGMGRHRTTENGKKVDSRVVVNGKADYDGPYVDSNALATAFAASPAVRECMARFMFRASAATGDSAATPGERQFIDFWRTIPAAAQGNIVETLIAYAKSPSFGVREVP